MPGEQQQTPGAQPEQEQQPQQQQQQQSATPAAGAAAPHEAPAQEPQRAAPLQLSIRTNAGDLPAQLLPVGHDVMLSEFASVAQGDASELQGVLDSFVETSLDFQYDDPIGADRWGADQQARMFLERKFGPDETVELLRACGRGIDRLGGQPVRDFLNSHPWLGNSPAAVVALAKHGGWKPSQRPAPTTSPKTGGGDGGFAARQRQQGTADARAQATAMLSDKAHPLNDPQHPDHAAAVQRWHELIARVG